MSTAIRRSFGHHLLVAAAPLATLALASSASAIPPFARRYETSCQTCHTAYPQLTPFGEAFRRNGYRWPQGEDPDRSVDEPIALGHDVHRDVFPDEVWPGEIPGNVPLGFMVSANVNVEREREAGGHGHGSEPAVQTEPHADEPWGVLFGESALGFLLGTTIGERISVFGKLEVLASGEVNLERPHVILSFLEPPHLMMRIGAFEPALPFQRPPQSDGTQLGVHFRWTR